jgi:hypothetical protein
MSAPHIIEDTDRDFKITTVSSFHGSKFSILERDRLFQRFYIRYPEFIDNGIIGPFWTFNGAVKFAESLQLDLQFVKPYNT